MKAMSAMSEEKRRKLDDNFRNANDLYWFCPVCKTKLTGTLTVLKEGCPCATAGKTAEHAADAGAS